MFAIAHKNKLAQNLMHLKKEFPDEYNFFPATYLLPYEMNLLRQQFFKKKEIHINRAIRMGVISTPKTKNSIRTIDILDNLMPYLKAQYELTSKKI